MSDKRITVFQKTGKKKDGTTFKKYVTTLTKKDGSKIYADVKFPNDVLSDYQADNGTVVKFPCIIVFDGNMTTRKSKVDKGDGTEREYINNYIWVKEIKSIEPYVDTSFDDIEF